jgi:rhamnosyltransferase
MNQKEQPKVFIIGARGIGNYGGFEAFLLHIVPLLRERGWNVYCSCEKEGRDDPGEAFGAHLVYFPIKPPKSYFLRKVFEIIYDNYFILISPRYSKKLLLLGTGGAPVVAFPRLFG